MPVQDVDLYRLPAASPSAAGKVRSFLAGQQDVDILRSLRGHSLDTLQRQLAGLPVSQVCNDHHLRLSPSYLVTSLRGIIIVCRTTTVLYCRVLIKLAHSDSSTFKSGIQIVQCLGNQRSSFCSQACLAVGGAIGPVRQ